MSATGKFVVYLAVALPCVSGCYIVPEIAHQPMVHNPFPQLSKIAIAPFFNLSTEPSVDGRLVALAYFNELQAVPGYEVVPVGVVEQAMDAFGITLSRPDDARRLAQALQVDAVVVGAVTDFDPYFPPRMTLQVEWYAANPCFHPIPPGFALPWHTSEEALIPYRLRLAAEMAAAKNPLDWQTPIPPQTSSNPHDAPADPGRGDDSQPHGGGIRGNVQASLTRVPRLDAAACSGQTASSGVPPARGAAEPSHTPPSCLDPAGETLNSSLPASWPRPACLPTGEPVLRHVATFDSRDDHFSQALKSYVSFREPISAGGPQGYLHRMPDFIRFCCHYHIYEMLSARGGADETRVVYRWLKNR